MAESTSLRQSIPHSGRGRWIAGAIAALVALVALLWILTSAFEGRHVQRNAASLTAPVTEPAATPARNQQP
jgi:hypothetical protein